MTGKSEAATPEWLVTVQEGESLWDVAKHFYTTEDSIREINQLEQDELAAGDILLVLKEVS